MVRMTAAKRRFSAHLFKAEKLRWYSDLEVSLPQSSLRDASSLIRGSQRTGFVNPVPSSDEEGVSGICR